MKKKLLIGIVLLFLILDYMALDDITTGNEPNFTGEYFLLLISIPLLAFLVFTILKKK